jgi:hypothetical protein
MISWELMVGNSNTRWHWLTPDGTPEPAIPWDAHMFPDGTPISYTEAKLIKRYITGQNEFIHVETFMNEHHDTIGDQYLTVNDSTSWNVPLKTNVSDGIYEFSYWPVEGGLTGFMLRVSLDSAGHVAASYFFAIDVTNQSIMIQKRLIGVAPKLLGTFDTSTLDCKMISDGWNIIRIVLTGGKIDLYFNPMHIDAVNGGIQPRLTVIDDQPLAAGGVQILAMGAPVLVDYMSILPVNLL